MGDQESAEVINMDNQARKALSVRNDDSGRVLGLQIIRPNRPWWEASFYEGFFLRGIQVDRIQAQPGSLSCTFIVPPRLTNIDGNLSPGAIASLVDKVGFSSIYASGHPWKVSTDMSISYMSTAKVDDELEISSRVLGFKGGYAGTHVVMTNKRTGEIVADHIQRRLCWDSCCLGQSKM